MWILTKTVLARFQAWNLDPSARPTFQQVTVELQQIKEDIESGVAELMSDSP